MPTIPPDDEPDMKGGAALVDVKSDDQVSKDAHDESAAVRSSRRRRQITIGLVAIVVAAAIVVVATRSSPSGDQAAAGKTTLRLAEGQSGVEAAGRSWRAIKGDWVFRGDRVSIEHEGRLLFSLLETDAGSANVTLSVRLPVVASGTSVVFRYSNAFNYWVLRAAPNVASWQLLKVVNGKGTNVGNTGLSATRDGTLVGVTTSTDGAISISFNSKFSTAFNDRDLADKHGVGMAGVGLGASRSIFSGFTVTPAAPSPTPAPVSKG